MQKTYRKLAKTSLVLVYLVIIAGAVVRMTGSGMGCPDWPKCFGHYIPPTTISELQWHPNKVFKKGQVIIKDGALWVVKDNFETGEVYNPENWVPYTKHDYAIFNPYHTWTEFINRLAGVLAGLGTLVLALFSLRFWKRKKQLTLLSWAAVFAMGFQGWLGATVVYSVLEPVKITIHMVMALAIVALLLYLIHETNDGKKRYRPNKTITGFLLLALGLTLVQIVLGTQVRQFIDDRIDLLGETAKALWLNKAPMLFYIHRSFSILVLLVNVYIAYFIYKKQLGLLKINWVVLLLILEICSGIAMNYVHFPFGSQPIHLVLASILFGVQFYLVLEVLKANKTLKTL